MMTMNVTPAEFRDIWEVCNDPQISEADVVAHMTTMYGCARYTSYRVVVHRRAPTIPMISWGLLRFDSQPGAVACDLENCHDDAYAKYAASTP